MQRYRDALSGYRNAIALAPTSKEGLAAKGRVETLVARPDRQLHAEVYRAVVDPKNCLIDFARYDVLRKAGYSFPSARPRFESMVRTLGASNEQVRSALAEFDRTVRENQFTDLKGNVMLVEKNQEDFGGLLPILGAFGITGGFSETEPQCPLGLLIATVEFTGRKNYDLWQRRGSLTAQERAELKQPKITFGHAEYVREEDRLVLK
jgi:hypothetical protein